MAAGETNDALEAQSVAIGNEEEDHVATSGQSSREESVTCVWGLGLIGGAVDQDSVSQNKGWSVGWAGDGKHVQIGK